MSNIFISYRRDDSRWQARLLYDALTKVLSPDRVFMDIDSIKPGDDFVEILEGWVQRCDILLALIGAGWVNATDPKTGKRRLDNPSDFVRIVVREALKRNIPVVPVLLDGASLPDAEELPDELKKLVRRQAQVVDFRTFDADVAMLIKRLKLGSGAKPIPTEDDRKLPEPEAEAGRIEGKRPEAIGSKTAAGRRTAEDEVQDKAQGRVMVPQGMVISALILGALLILGIAGSFMLSRGPVEKPASIQTSPAATSLPSVAHELDGPGTHSRDRLDEALNPARRGNN